MSHLKQNALLRCDFDSEFHYCMKVFAIKCAYERRGRENLYMPRDGVYVVVMVVVTNFNNQGSSFRLLMFYKYL